MVVDAGTVAVVVDVVVEEAAGTVVGETVVVVVDGGTTDPFPQQPMEAFQCFQPPFE